MNTTIKMKNIIATIMGLSFLLAVVPAEAVEIRFFKQQFGQSQEQMGREIMQSAWLRWNYGTVQERLGSFIQAGGEQGAFVQEELGSGIAAAAHLRWEGMKAQERIGLAISNVSAVLKKEARIWGPEVIQERLGTAILANAQTAYRVDVDNRVADRIALVAAQEGMGREIQTAASVNWTGGMMAQTAYATLEGRNTEAIPFSMFATLRSAKAFELEQNFRLAMGILAAETGMPMTAILPQAPGAVSASGTYSADVSPGWGGFGEYGLWSILAFLYVGYLFCRNTFDAHYEGGVQETPWIYQKAA